jgi:hypothetical protein
MLKFTSVSASVPVIMDITRIATIIRTGTTDHIIARTTGRTTGTAGIVITAIITPIITGTKVDRSSHTGLARAIEPAGFFKRQRADHP